MTGHCCQCKKPCEQNVVTGVFMCEKCYAEDLAKHPERYQTGRVIFLPQLVEKTK